MSPKLADEHRDARGKARSKLAAQAAIEGQNPGRQIAPGFALERNDDAGARDVDGGAARGVGDRLREFASCVGIAGCELVADPAHDAPVVEHPVGGLVRVRDAACGVGQDDAHGKAIEGCGQHVALERAGVQADRRSSRRGGYAG